MAQSLREKLKAKMAQRTEESYARRESSGRFRSIFKDDIPFPLWKIGGGDHMVDILPYMVGSNDPQLDRGEPSYHLEIYVHGKVGPTEDNYVCPSMNYKMPCPICEELRKMEKAGAAKEELDEIRPKRRCVYFVLVHDDEKEYNKGPQIMEISHWFMERHLTALANNTRTRGGAVVTGQKTPFASPDEDGKTVKFEKQGTGMSSQIIAHQFLDRDYSIEDGILEQLQSLDELINIPTYDELYNAFHGKGVSSDAESVPGAPSGEEEYTQEEEGGFQAPEGMDDMPEGGEEEGGEEVAEEGGEDVCPGGGTIGEDIEKQGMPCGECPIYDRCSEVSSELAAQAEAQAQARAATRSAAPKPAPKPAPAAAKPAPAAAKPAPAGRAAAPAPRTAPAPAAASRGAAPAPRGAAPRPAPATPAGRGPRR